ncbi:MAG: ABC transporter ATP-binding protein [Candidatus Izemoplasma sp.]
MIFQIINRCMKFKRIFLIINFLLIIIYTSELLIPYIFSGFIDEVSSNNSMEFATESIVIIAVLTVILMISSYFHHIFSEVIIAKTSFQFLNDIDQKLEQIPLSNTKKYNPAYLNNRVINDIIISIGFVINNLIVSIIMVISILILFILIIKINLFLVFIPIGALVINISGILILNKLFYERGYKYRELNSQYVSENNDLIANIKETKINSWYDISGDKVKISFKKLLKTGISLNKILAALNNIGKFSKNLTLIITMLVGGTLIINQKITIGEFVLITFYTNMCLVYSEYFLKLGQEYQHAKISFDRLNEFLDIKSEDNGTILLNNINSIEIKELKFTYPESTPLFTNFKYNFKKGNIYCLKGKNGEGKSTLIDLLLGLDYNFTGSIKYNNYSLSELDMIGLRKNQISVIMQEPRLQRISVKNNLIRGLDSYSFEVLNELCTEFNLSNIIDLQESLSLSGGEKQKVSIVRGLLKNASLLILDEPVSALDTASIEVLKKELIKRKDNSIIIIISHNEEIFDIVDEFIVF